MTDTSVIQLSDYHGVPVQAMREIARSRDLIARSRAQMRWTSLLCEEAGFAITENRRVRHKAEAVVTPVASSGTAPEIHAPAHRRGGCQAFARTLQDARWTFALLFEFHGVTPAQFAKLMGVPPDAYIRYERGGEVPPLEFLVKFRQGLTAALALL